MVRVAPIRLAFNPRTLWFDPRDLDIHNGDDVVVLRQGRVVEQGPVARVLTESADAYTRALVAAAPRLRRG